MGLLWLGLLLALLLQGCGQEQVAAVQTAPAQTASATYPPTQAATATPPPPSPSATVPSATSSSTRAQATATVVSTATGTALPRSTPSITRPLPTATIVHIIQEGDTLLAIALRYGVSVEGMQKVNGIEDPQRLKLGQKLIIPPPDPTPQATRTPSASPTAKTPGTMVLGCPTNITTRKVALDAEPIRLVVLGEQAYLVAGGELFVVPLADLAGEGDLVPQSAMPPERKVGPYTIQELVYAAADDRTGELVLLDKSNDIYRRTTAGEWRMAIPASSVRGAPTDPQYLALQPLGDDLYVLDADNSRIWKFAHDATQPTTYLQATELGTGVDLAMTSGEDGGVQALVMDRRSRVLRFSGDQLTARMAIDGGGKPWPAQVSVTARRTMVVEGEQRRVILVDGLRSEAQITIEFRFPGMRRLRSAALVGDTLYALAGSSLYSVSLKGETGGCPAAPYDNGYYYAGREMGDLISEARLPFPNAALPGRPRSYPGARRLYRHGVHEGVDLYPGDVAGLAYGSPIAAIGAGAVVRADTAFVEMTPLEYQEIIARTEAEHRTPPDVLDKLRGQQVYMAHGPGIEAHYCHLQGITPGIEVGAQVAGGDVLGQVGASGTQDGVERTGAGEHLHWEIWIDGHYLGYGLSLYETMRLWQAIFAPA